ncbi:MULTISPECIES: universal stress protein [Enterobacterales]|uniref:universal stress protein n=1 Tax=Enterobacterales TaxID=91347 RepID=UPI00066D485E|nr:MULTISPECIES: universal stress protein [Enterobacterales]MBA7930210.1 universal stress protein [Klebsiella sp. RHBSTW-00215]MBN5198691.1 universal stress protein [Serratia marcescens]SUI42137.1 Universal stress protein A [Serratia liquefaciens]HEJ7948257.1 universal stress protein [Serratia liquefaciens]
MSYQHIVIATDLSDGDIRLIEKGAALAKVTRAKLSLIHVDIHHAPYYSAMGLQTYHYDGEVPTNVTTQQALAALALRSSYPIPDAIMVTGELVPALRREILARGIDLIIFGHHQDLWSNLFSATRQAINNLEVDVLVIPMTAGTEEI